MVNSCIQLPVAALAQIGVCVLSLSARADDSMLRSPLRRASMPVEFVSTDGRSVEFEPAHKNSDRDCKPIVDDPLWKLSVDTLPVDRRGQIELEPNWTPTICPAPVLANAPSVYMGMNPSAFCKWPIWPGAEFCHRPLYFEEPCVERCGRTQCCQPAVSAAHFFCSAALLPVRACPHPFSGYECTPPAF